MRRLIPEHIEDDCAFLYAEEVIHDRNENEWTIHIDPDACLAGPAGEVNIDEVRNSDLAKKRSNDKIRYSGKILFSAGIVIVFDGKRVLLKRDEGLDADPGKWTSPAGRCEAPPKYTALKEFYEELVISYGPDQDPVFVTTGDISKQFTDIYESSLTQVADSKPVDNWITLQGSSLRQARDQYETVRTVYGEDVFSNELLPFFDKSSNTLELRLAIEVETPAGKETTSFNFKDAEFDRQIDRFGADELRALSEAGKLVPADDYIVENFALLS